MQGQNTSICEHCVTEWGEKLAGTTEGEGQEVREATRHKPEDEEEEGSGEQGTGSG